MVPSKKWVFVIDDSQTVRKNLSDVLVKGGYDIAEATDGTEALKRLGQQRFDLILMDIEMPGLNGFELLRIIEAGSLAHDAPILVITGTHRDLDVIHEIKNSEGRASSTSPLLPKNFSSAFLNPLLDKFFSIFLPQYFLLFYKGSA